MNKVLDPGLTQNKPASSCAEIFNNTPSALSGYYWLQSVNGSAVRVYCDMSLNCKGVGGGWMQVVKLNMTNSSHQCPHGTILRTDLPKRLCGSSLNGPGCSSTIFDVHGIGYRKVCGKIIAYQDGTPDAFGAWDITTRSNNIDSNYVDGISLTHGNSPRQHIWTFAGAIDETGENRLWRSYCPCTDKNQPSFTSIPPGFVGNDYFCDTGSENDAQFMLYFDDPLWDGAGCGPANTCCSLNNPPWFMKQLPSSTTDDIEMRMCHDESYTNEDTPIEIIELYIQ